MTESAARPSPLLPVATAVAVAGLILIVAVLPAEYGLDPTGMGRVLGLTALAPTDRARVSALTDHLDAPTPDTARLETESLTFELGPFESVEYKYRLTERDGLIYRWASTGPVLVNFHSEPDDPSIARANGAPEGESAVSFNQGRASGNYGTYVAPFTGIHGWFWQNRGTAPVVIELQTSGFFSAAIDYRGGFPFEKPFPNTTEPQ